MKYVLFYESTPDFREKVPLYIDAHRARWSDFHSRGLLLMVGPLMDAPGAAMGIFTTREAAEEFVRDDPFVLHGVVANWRIREWNEVLFQA